MEYSERYQESDNSSGFAIGMATLLVGAAVGAAVVLLLNPETGQKVRESVGVRTADWKDQAANVLSQGREKIITAIEGIK